MSEYNAEGRRIKLVIWYPELPPTSNKIYFKGTRLTEVSRAYRENFRKYVQQHYGHQISEFVEANFKAKDPNTGELVDIRTQDPNLVFALNLYFYMDTLTSWNDMSVPKSRRARFRFQKTDLSNRIKLLEDCFKYAVDIDDSLTFEAKQKKIHASPRDQGVYLEYYAVPVEQFGIPFIAGG